MLEVQRTHIQTRSLKVHVGKQFKTANSHDPCGGKATRKNRRGRQKGTPYKGLKEKRKKQEERSKGNREERKKPDKKVQATLAEVSIAVVAPRNATRKRVETR